MTKRRSVEEILTDAIVKEVKENLYAAINGLPPEHALRLLNALVIYCETQRLRIIKRMEGET